MCRQSILAIALCIEPRRAAAMPSSTAIIVTSWPCDMYRYRSVLASASRWPCSPRPSRKPAWPCWRERGLLYTIQLRPSSPSSEGPQPGGQRRSAAAVPLWNSGHIRVSDGSATRSRSTVAAFGMRPEA